MKSAEVSTVSPKPFLRKRKDDAVVSDADRRSPILLMDSSNAEIDRVDWESDDRLCAQNLIENLGKVPF